MQQNYELVPAYYSNVGKPQEVFANLKVTPAVFLDVNNPKQVEFAQKVADEAQKLGPYHRPIIFIATLFHTADPAEALKQIAGWKINAGTMALAGDPYLYPTQTPTLVYWDANGKAFKTVSDENTILKMIPTLLDLHESGNSSGGNK